MTSIFDKDAFLGAESQESSSVRRIPIPAEETLGRIKGIDLRTPKDSVILVVTWIVDSEEARTITGIPEPTVRQDMFLDITDDGQIDFGEGQNVALGRLRAALGQNEEGVSWSPNMMIGEPGLLDIGHRPDKNDPETVYAEVKRVTAA